MSRSRPITVFITEDSQSYSEMLAELISEPGRIEIAGFADTAEAAIEQIGRLKPDAVILDIQLRSGNGPAVIRAVRSTPGLKDTKLMVMSNLVSADFKKRCMELGCDQFFDKSRDFDLLTSALDALWIGRNG